MQRYAEAEDEMFNHNKMKSSKIINLQKFHQTTELPPKEVDQVQQDEDTVMNQTQALQEEEVIETNGSSLKCQIDMKKLIQDEAKQFIFTQEQFKLKSSNISIKNQDVQKLLDELKERIKETQNAQIKEELATKEDIKKMKTHENLALSITGLLDSLKEYANNFETRIKMIQDSNMDNEIKEFYSDTVKLIQNKEDTIKQFKSEITANKQKMEKYKVNLMNETKNLQEVNNTLQKQLDNLAEEEKCITTEMELAHMQPDIIVEKQKKKREENNEAEQKYKSIEHEIFDLRLKKVENLKLHSLNKQKLEFELQILSRSNESATIAVEKLTREIEEPTRLEEVLNELGDFTDGEINPEELKDQTCDNMKMKLEELVTSNEELSKAITEKRNLHINLLQKCHDMKTTLAETNYSCISVQNRLSDTQTLNSKENSPIEDLKKHKLDMETTSENLSDKIEEAEKIQASDKLKGETLKLKLETLKSEIEKYDGEIAHQNNITIGYLEDKKKNLEQNIAEIDKKNTESLEKIKAINKKHKEKHKSLKRIFSMLNSRPQSSLNLSMQSSRSDGVIESEQPINENEVKSILKSPIKSVPLTPNKSISFVGVSSIESMSSNEKTDDKTFSFPKVEDPFDALKRPLKRKRVPFD